MRRSIFLGVFILFGTFAQPQDLSTILQKHFEAHGQELWDQIGTVVIDGEWVTTEFRKFPMKLTYKQPNKVRLEGMWGRKKYAQVTNGKVAWTVAPWTGTSHPQLMTPLEHMTIANTFSPGSALKLYRETVNLQGLELFEGELLIKLTYEDAYTAREFYLGKEDYILYWEVIRSKVGQMSVVKKQYENYHNYSGLLAPTAVRFFAGDEEKELVFADVSLGVGAANSIFEMPKGH
ncbi:MAG: hypothetical protein ABJG41_07820 [Cyclobacteriaceae bacterium]